MSEPAVAATGARGYSWPPFEPGNEAALRHGAYSPRRVDPLAAELAAGALDDPDLAHLTAPGYRPAVWAWARAEAQVQLLAEHVERIGLDFGDHAVSAAHTALDRAERRAERSRRALGLDPLARARLGRDHAAARVDVVEVLTRMAEQRDAAAVPSPPTTAPPAETRPTTPEGQR
ncbi:hypothetical protein [Pseudonocardia hydrocarbonoxydans]|uniref:Uncharacterized protein n=1 Tax=Pseudonocardia hydrocarbonoxydans TaxID=76726 RepID=A0A4Y3WTC1_9PSEU|nr:hypothetical protein [Pseudonocardia hydrocarbonoxydans]GEC22135.1 hypothetical protein PHY01_44180 [Pseudonocardia hydrocarbonoxydans]